MSGLAFIGSKLTLPIGKQGSPTEIHQPELATYEKPPYFRRWDDHVLCRAPVDGVTTPNTYYARAELRFLNEWRTDKGKHWLEAGLAITETPGGKPHVVCAQIHDGSDDVMQVRLEAKHLFVVVGSKRITLTDNYRLGNRFHLRIGVKRGRIHVHYNGVYLGKIKRKASGCYWKCGCYTQATNKVPPSSDKYGTGAGEVIIYSLDVG
jgi:hypothetical protein